jgi:hypothetical protein
MPAFETPLGRAALNPQLTIKFFAETMPPEPIVIDGLRKAGLPEE